MIVEASKPIRGTMVFSAREGTSPVQGIEIRVDGEPRGTTGVEGELRVEWLIAGEHDWRALQGEAEVSGGSMQIEEVTDLEFVGMWVEVDGHEGVKTYKWRPLLDTVAVVSEIKNTGTTMIKRYLWNQTTKADMKVDLLHPKIPAQAWKPFAGNLLASSYGREFVIREGRIEAINPAINRPLEVVARTPLAEEGLRPGQTLVTEEKKVYMRFLEEAMDVKAAELNTDVRFEIVDREKGVMDTVIKEFKFGPIKFHNMRARTVMKAKFTSLYELSVDHKVCDSKEVQLEYV